MIQYPSSILLRRMIYGIENDLGIIRRLVRVIDASKAFDLAAARLTVHAFHISLLANRKRGVDKYLDKSTSFEHPAHLIARSLIRANGSANGQTPMPDYFGCNKADSQNVCVSILLAKTQPFRKVCPNGVTIQHGNASAMF